MEVINESRNIPSTRRENDCENNIEKEDECEQDSKNGLFPRITHEFGLLHAVPKNRRSTAKAKKIRRQNWAMKVHLRPQTYRECHKCGAPVLLHHVCLQCLSAPPRTRPELW